MGSRATEALRRAARSDSRIGARVRYLDPRADRDRTAYYREYQQRQSEKRQAAILKHLAKNPKKLLSNYMTQINDRTLSDEGMSPLEYLMAKEEGLL